MSKVICPECIIFNMTEKKYTPRDLSIMIFMSSMLILKKISNFSIFQYYGWLVMQSIERELISFFLLRVTFHHHHHYYYLFIFQKNIMDSIHKDDPSFDADAYTSLAIVYAVFALCNWFAPSIISVSGPRIAMIIGAITYM